MNVAELLQQAQGEGVMLALVDDRLTWEADHKPPVELLAAIRSQRMAIIEALQVAAEPPQRAWSWLGTLAVLLGCSPDYLLAHGFVDRHDLTEQHRTPPRLAAGLIRSHPDWRQPLGRRPPRRSGSR